MIFVTPDCIWMMVVRWKFIELFFAWLAHSSCEIFQKKIIFQCSNEIIFNYRTLFASQLNTSNPAEIHIQFVRTEIMECVIDFAYTSTCTITETNAIELIATAEYFGFLQLIDYCAHFIVNNLNETNCISMMTMTRFVWIIFNSFTNHETILFK